MEYVKIHSLWKRQGWYFEESKKKDSAYQKERQSFIIGDYAEPEFGNVKKWLVDEKIDGTNVRIIWEKPQLGGPHILRFGGRTDAAQMPCHLLDRLQEIFTHEKLAEHFPDAQRVILYGEGYGTKIQGCGGNYRGDVGFILFDVWISGWWLQRSAVKEIAQKLEVDVVPNIGIMTEEEIIDFVKSKPLSQCSRIPQMIEGVVCRADPLMLFRNGKPIMFKLKCKEFV